MIDGWIHAWTRRSRKQWMRKSEIFTVSSNVANDSFNLFVSIFVSFSINGLKENAENWNYHPILRTKVELFLFSVISPRMRNFFFVASSSAVNSDYDQYNNTQGTTGRIMMMMMTMMIKKKKKNIDTLFWPRRHRRSITDALHWRHETGWNCVLSVFGVRVFFVTMAKWRNNFSVNIVAPSHVSGCPL